MKFERSSRCTSVLTLHLVLFAYGSAASSKAAEHSIVLDPEASAVSFSLKATGHVVRGDFRLKSGELRFAPESGTLVGEIILDATSAESGNKRRDRAMHRKVLESDRYPRIILRPERFSGDWSMSGQSVLTLFGTLSLHGDEHPLMMEVAVEIEGNRFSAESTFSVPFVDWGLRDPSVLFLRVAKAVEVTVKTQGSISSPVEQE